MWRSRSILPKLWPLWPASPAARRTRPLRNSTLGNLLSDLHQSNAVRARLVNEEVMRTGHPHVPDDAHSRRNRPALEFLGFWVEAHKSVRSHSRLVVPDDVVNNG